jgi:uncharacterized coiled-coil DUF342 family protein
VDRVYKAGIPQLRKELERLQKEFSELKPSTDWVRLRVDPVLRLAQELERRLSSREFSAEFSRLSRGVSLFHSDLVYLRTNVKELGLLLQNERKRQSR